MADDLIRITLHFFLQFLIGREIYIITYVNPTIGKIFVPNDNILPQLIDFTYFNLISRIFIFIYDVIIAVCHGPLKSYYN